MSTPTNETPTAAPDAQMFEVLRTRELARIAVESVQRHGLDQFHLGYALMAEALSRLLMTDIGTARAIAVEVMDGLMKRVLAVPPPATETPAVDPAVPDGNILKFKSAENTNEQNSA